MSDVIACIFNVEPPASVNISVQVTIIAFGVLTRDVNPGVIS